MINSGGRERAATRLLFIPHFSRENRNYVGTCLSFLQAWLPPAALNRPPPTRLANKDTHRGGVRVKWGVCVSRQEGLKIIKHQFKHFGPSVPRRDPLTYAVNSSVCSRGCNISMALAGTAGMWVIWQCYFYAASHNSFHPYGCVEADADLRSVVVRENPCWKGQVIQKKQSERNVEENKRAFQSFRRVHKQKALIRISEVLYISLL